MNETEPEGQTGVEECDHWVGMKWWDYEGYDPVRQSHLRITNLSGERDIQFDFCPRCGKRLTDNQQTKP